MMQTDYRFPMFIFLNQPTISIFRETGRTHLYTQQKAHQRKSKNKRYYFNNTLKKGNNALPHIYKYDKLVCSLYLFVARLYHRIHNIILVALILKKCNDVTLCSAINYEILPDISMQHVFIIESIKLLVVPFKISLNNTLP